MHIEETLSTLSGLGRRRKNRRGDRGSGGEEVLVLKLQKGWERLSRDYREKVGDRYDLDTLYSCMKLVHSNFFKRKHKGPVRSTQFVTGSLIGSTEPGVEAFKNIRRVHKQLSGWIISRWEKLRWRKRKDV